ncbi:MAG: hypothetical protein HIU84_05520 [Acidobacteria bacterium]|nr:hypothetical protein [Acidobacteriota bacterium]
MPRISAATLAEHQVLQRQAIINAAVDVLAGGEVTTLDVGIVSRHAGLARTSLYQYFDSLAGLVASVVIFACEARQNALTGIPGDGEPAVAEYISRAFSFALSDVGRAERALTRGDLPAPCREQLLQLRADARRPLIGLLVDLGHCEPTLESEIFDAALEAAADMVIRGCPRESTERALSTLLIHD